ncbi:hypothetical protein [Paenibacillus soyae]|uniref:DUF3169 family protein n=1 Tax=Paenibacillus soyae TaxID=2969249 RepID=A0A9X2MT18_9BACL|nr:hypothetical protein [Paenibacillus soyae]MCR2805945.1 hypothetical protein [Paenibacillus soyae]
MSQITKPKSNLKELIIVSIIGAIVQGTCGYFWGYSGLIVSFLLFFVALFFRMFSLELHGETTRMIFVSYIMPPIFSIILRFFIVTGLSIKDNPVLSVAGVLILLSMCSFFHLFSYNKCCNESKKKISAYKSGFYNGHRINNKELRIKNEIKVIEGLQEKIKFATNYAMFVLGFITLIFKLAGYQDNNIFLVTITYYLLLVLFIQTFTEQRLSNIKTH